MAPRGPQIHRGPAVPCMVLSAGAWPAQARARPQKSAAPRQLGQRPFPPAAPAPSSLPLRHLCEQAALGLKVSTSPVCTTCELGRGSVPCVNVPFPCAGLLSERPSVASREPGATGWVSRALEGPVDPVLCQGPWSRLG